MESKRATGRTFRRLLKACVAASEGQKVIFCTTTIHDAKQAFRKCADVIDRLIDIDTISFDPQALKIVFPNYGSITFTSTKNTERGVKVDTIIVDDYKTEDY